jgi:hypothetical protein
MYACDVPDNKKKKKKNFSRMRSAGGKHTGLLGEQPSASAVTATPFLVDP